MHEGQKVTVNLDDRSQQFIAVGVLYLLECFEIKVSRTGDIQVVTTFGQSLQELETSNV